MHVHPDKNGHPRAREAFDALRTAKEEMEKMDGGDDEKTLDDIVDELKKWREEFMEQYRRQKRNEEMRARETWWW